LAVFASGNNDVDALDATVWLNEHAKGLLDVPGFLTAEVFEHVSDDDTKRQFVAQYRVENQQAMDAYFTEHAPARRNEAMASYVMMCYSTTTAAAAATTSRASGGH
jgi:hypothetical protein